MTEASKTILNPEKNRFELSIEGELAVIDYTFKKSINQIFLVHTEVPEALRGNGWGEKLVGDSLEIIRNKGYKVVPICPFVITYLKRHKSYLNLVDESRMELFT